MLRSKAHKDKPLRLGLTITVMIPNFERIKEETDLPGLEDHLQSAIVNSVHQARYIKALEERIRELRHEK